MKTTRIYHSIYEVCLEGRKFEIDCQGSKEWKLFEVSQDEFEETREWWATYPTKRDAIYGALKLVA